MTLLFYIAVDIKCSSHSPRITSTAPYSSQPSICFSRSTLRQYLALILYFSSTNQKCFTEVNPHSFHLQRRKLRQGGGEVTHLQLHNILAEMGRWLLLIPLNGNKINRSRDIFASTVPSHLELLGVGMQACGIKELMGTVENFGKDRRIH